MYGYNYHRPNRSLRTTAALFILSGLIPLRVHAQESPGGTETDRRFAEMTALIQKLQARVDDLEGNQFGKSFTANALGWPRVARKFIICGRRTVLLGAWVLGI